MVFMNVAEHTVPSFCCGDGAASSVVAHSLSESDLFLGCAGGKKACEVSDLMHCSDRGEMEQ